MRAGPDLGAARAVALAPPTFGDRLRGAGSRANDALGELYKSKTGFCGALMLVGFVAVAILTPWIDRYDPIKIDYRIRLEAPSAEHYFGTDRFGRDIYSRVLWGGRRLLVISLLAVGVGLAIGIPLGVLAGFYGGWTDTIAMRIVDGFLAFPGLLLFLLVVTLANEWHLEGVWKDVALIFALGVAFMPETARLARGIVLGEKRKEYVEASRLVGNRGVYTAMREILPNCVSPLIVHATVLLGFVILIIAALSYLGLGTAPPTPDWGSDLRAAQDHMETQPLVAVFPGLAIFYAVLSFNLLGDGLRDILDPRIAER